MLLVHAVVAHCTLLSAVSRELGVRSVAAKFSPDIVTGTAAEITALNAPAVAVFHVITGPAQTSAGSSRRDGFPHRRAVRRGATRCGVERRGAERRAPSKERYDSGVPLWLAWLGPRTNTLPTLFF